MKYDNLNYLESEILEKIKTANSEKLPLLKHHIDRLLVLKRETTGVGMYVHFSYIGDGETYKKICNKDCAITSDKELTIKGLKYPVNYELNLTDGRIDFLEIASNGEAFVEEVLDFNFD